MSDLVREVRLMTKNTFYSFNKHMIRRSTAPTTWTDWRKSSTFEHVFIYMESFCASPQVKQDRGVDAASASEQDFNCISLAPMLMQVELNVLC